MKKKKRFYVVRLWRKTKRYLKSWIGTHPGKALRLGGVLILLNIIFLASIISLGVVAAKWHAKINTQSLNNNNKIVVTQKATQAPETTKKPSATVKPQTKEDKAKKVYTFFQGPKTWSKRMDWSGKWGVTYYDGASFGAFGCGLCCMANIYSTFTSYQASPIDVYEYAKKHTEYGGGGAIDWGYMKGVLLDYGFDCDVMRKPKTYKAFRNEVESGICQLVLISSSNSTCYWEDTPGHYVTIFLYDRESDKVFLADSGDPKHNRSWIPLKYIYKSLKTESKWQYIQVKSYNQKNCKWKHKNANGKWVKPEYISK